ncbi:P-loop containing nucleoside triphosphate hydrolase protein [Crepidotus variabilis]|uniref:P-loop containing nucleoside triphosphate hydrolase protein n=1 Tax=Crepidotus variabilis TaxID=179855 RepID=A0A9P6JU80_9AGAR|nr:P-loop containing nucleoside triphosphate hydrolase protein [Crepidotus variabilis]
MVDSTQINADTTSAIIQQNELSEKRGFFYRKTRKKAQQTHIEEKGAETFLIGEEEKELEVPPVAVTQLFRYSTRKEILLDLIGLVAAAAAGAAQPLMSLLFGDLTQAFVDFSVAMNQARVGGSAISLDAAAAHLRRAASHSASYLVYLGLGLFICTFTYMYIWVYTGEVNAKRIREKYLQAVLRQEIAYFDNHVGAGEVATRIQTDTHLVQKGMSEKVALVVNFLAAFVCGFVLAYIRSWRLALAMTSIIPCIFINGAILTKFVSKYMQLSLQYSAEGGTIAEEVISTVRTVQAFGTQSVLSSLYNERVEKSLSMDIKSAALTGGSFASFLFVIYSGYALAFSFGTTLINEGHADAGVVVNVFLAILIGALSLVLLAPELQAVTQACGAAAKLYQTIDRVPEIDSASNDGLKPDKVSGEISLEGIKFSYPSRPTIQVVKGVDLTFRAGKTAALVGASGSGKSTIISLVERFYDPTAGTVKLDGVDIKDLNLKWLRSQIGLVSQEPTLFATTIKGNVAHGLINTPYENASDDEREALIKEACIKANADGFISKLPLGYNTMVGERGFLLSGGQKQRIAIARAIVSDPRILLLDEATSALDTQSEGIVQDALDKASAGRTTISIAHRLSTIKDADTIFVMGDGLVIERGNHIELLAKQGSYARLVQAQKLRETVEQTVIDVGDSENLEDPENLEKSFAEEIPLERKPTKQSLASEIAGQLHNSTGAQPGDDDYGLFYIFKRMAPLIRDQWKNYSFAALFASLNGAVYPCFSIVFAKGIEGFSLLDPHERRKAGDRNALWFFVIAILATGLIGGQHYFFGYASSVLTARLRMLSFRTILRQDIEFFDADKNSTGALTAQLSFNPQKVNGLAGSTLGAIVQSIATVVVGSILGIIFIWKVGLVGMACAPLLVSTGYVRLRIITLKDQTNKKAHEESAQMACEATGSIRTVAALTREDDCLHDYSTSLETPLRISNRASLWSSLLFSFSQAQTFWIIALIFWWGAVLVSRFEANTFQFFIALMGTTFGAIEAGNVFMFVPDISSALGAGSDIIKLIDNKIEIDAESPEGKVVTPDAVRGRIRFENIHFRYPTRPGVRILRDFSLEVEPGTYIALVGASGSGKSTIIQLIERFYDPLVGDIHLDGEKITELNIQEYRKHLALVSQEPTLYAGTVRFNILLGANKPDEYITEEEIEAACRDANILEFIQGLPKTFDTEVGGKGSQLSGGQKQRIAIARALLRNPKVLLLDEATSALDSNSEKIVQAALDQAAKGRTTIAVAHRLSTIQNADRIYFIKEGRVCESGTHDQLLTKRGDYYDYVQLQTLNKSG